MTYLAGIDGGGTGCRVILSDGTGRVLGAGKAGPANIMTNFDGARANIVGATARAISAAGLAPDIIAEISAFLGLAGANNPERVRRMSACLPFKQNRIVTDAHTSLQGAIGEWDGAAAIIGTGSVFINRIGDIYRTVGGWGFMIGDLGSGARLGRSLLEETLLSYDGVHAGSALTRRVLAQFEDNPQSLVEYAQTAPPGAFGEFAPLIFEFRARNDAIAQGIVLSAVADIEQALDAIIVSGSPNFCMLGGLGEVYADLLSETYRAAITPPLGDAASGALSFAVRHFGRGAGGDRQHND